MSHNNRGLLLLLISAFIFSFSSLLHMRWKVETTVAQQIEKEVTPPSPSSTVKITLDYTTSDGIVEHKVLACAPLANGGPK